TNSGPNGFFVIMENAPAPSAIRRQSAADVQHVLRLNQHILIVVVQNQVVAWVDGLAVLVGLPRLRRTYTGRVDWPKSNDATKCVPLNLSEAVAARDLSLS